MFKEDFKVALSLSLNVVILIVLELFKSVMLVLMVVVASEIAGSFHQKTLCTITCSPCLLFLPLPMLAFNVFF